MTQGQKQPPEGPTDAAEAAPSTERAPFTARLFLAAQPLRGRRWLLTGRDWVAVGWLLLVGTAGIYLLYDQVQRMPPATRPIGEGLLLALATITGALLTYTILRRALADLRLMAADLGDLGQEATTLSRSLLDEARNMVETAYAAGQQDAADWRVSADQAQERITELERELAARRAGLPAGPDLRELARRSAELQTSIEAVQALASQNDAKIAEASAEIAAAVAESKALAAEFDRLTVRRWQQLDAIDQQILDLLTADPALTDEEIGRHPKVALERSQVTRRRNRLAAAGYPAAQKRQGQRPSTR